MSETSSPAADLPALNVVPFRTGNADQQPAPEQASGPGKAFWLFEALDGKKHPEFDLEPSDRLVIWAIAKSAYYDAKIRRYWLKLSHEKIAAITGLSPSTVGRAINRQRNSPLPLICVRRPPKGSGAYKQNIYELIGNPGGFAASRDARRQKNVHEAEARLLENHEALVRAQAAVELSPEPGKEEARAILSDLQRQTRGTLSPKVFAGLQITGLRGLRLSARPPEPARRPEPQPKTLPEASTEQTPSPSASTPRDCPVCNHLVIDTEAGVCDYALANTARGRSPIGGVHQCQSSVTVTCKTRGGSPAAERAPA